MSQLAGVAVTQATKSNQAVVGLSTISPIVVTGKGSARSNRGKGSSQIIEEQVRYSQAPVRGNDAAYTRIQDEGLKTHIDEGVAALMQRVSGDGESTGHETLNDMFSELVSKCIVDLHKGTIDRLKIDLDKSVLSQIEQYAEKATALNMLEEVKTLIHRQIPVESFTPEQRLAMYHAQLMLKVAIGQAVVLQRGVYVFDPSSQMYLYQIDQLKVLAVSQSANANATTQTACVIVIMDAIRRENDGGRAIFHQFAAEYTRRNKHSQFQSSSLGSLVCLQHGWGHSRMMGAVSMGGAAYLASNIACPYGMAIIGRTPIVIFPNVYFALNVVALIATALLPAKVIVEDTVCISDEDDFLKRMVSPKLFASQMAVTQSICERLGDEFEGVCTEPMCNAVIGLSFIAHVKQVYTTRLALQPTPFIYVDGYIIGVPQGELADAYIGDSNTSEYKPEGPSNALEREGIQQGFVKKLLTYFSKWNTADDASMPTTYSTVLFNGFAAEHEAFPAGMGLAELMLYVVTLPVIPDTSHVECSDLEWFSQIFETATTADPSPHVECSDLECFPQIFETATTAHTVTHSQQDTDTQSPRTAVLAAQLRTNAEGVEGRGDVQTATKLTNALAPSPAPPAPPAPPAAANVPDTSTHAQAATEMPETSPTTSPKAATKPSKTPQSPPAAAPTEIPDASAPQTATKIPDTSAPTAATNPPNTSPLPQAATKMHDIPPATATKNAGDTSPAKATEMPGISAPADSLLSRQTPTVPSTHASYEEFALISGHEYNTLDGSISTDTTKLDNMLSMSSKFQDSEHNIRVYSNIFSVIKKYIITRAKVVSSSTASDVIQSDALDVALCEIHKRTADPKAYNHAIDMLIFLTIPSVVSFDAVVQSNANAPEDRKKLYKWFAVNCEVWFVDMLQALSTAHNKVILVQFLEIRCDVDRDLTQDSHKASAKAARDGVDHLGPIAERVAALFGDYYAFAYILAIFFGMYGLYSMYKKLGRIMDVLLDAPRSLTSRSWQSLTKLYSRVIGKSDEQISSAGGVAGAWFSSGGMSQNEMDELFNTQLPHIQSLHANLGNSCVDGGANGDNCVPYTVNGSGRCRYHQARIRCSGAINSKPTRGLMFSRCAKITTSIGEKITNARWDRPRFYCRHHEEQADWANDWETQNLRPGDQHTPSAPPSTNTAHTQTNTAHSTTTSTTTPHSTTTSTNTQPTPVSVDVATCVAFQYAGGIRMSEMMKELTCSLRRVYDMTQDDSLDGPGLTAELTNLINSISPETESPDILGPTNELRTVVTNIVRVVQDAAKSKKEKAEALTELIQKIEKSTIDMEVRCSEMHDKLAACKENIARKMQEMRGTNDLNNTLKSDNAKLVADLAGLGGGNTPAKTRTLSRETADDAIYYLTSLASQISETQYAIALRQTEIVQHISGAASASTVSGSPTSCRGDQDHDNANMQSRASTPQYDARFRS